MDEQMNLFAITRDKNKEPDKAIPEGVKVKRGMLWCPYCSTIVKFEKDKQLGVSRCPFCGISDRDYNVKVVNKRWK
ncbi:MAG: hypothetical protein M0Q88_02950 [Bacilli bacterium]|nr:hypothetical protein [Bacilli bacterium]